MEYLEKLTSNPYYENMLIDASYVSAMMNAEVGTNYDVGKYLNGITSDNSSVRNWGEVNYTQNDRDISGLTGEARGSREYAFFFHSIYPMTSILPTAKYDPSYAKIACKWALNIANSTHYFLPSEWYVYNRDDSETSLVEMTSTGKLIPNENGVVKVVAKAVDGSGVIGEAMVTIKNQDVPNLALNKTVLVSKAETGNPKEGVTDGNPNTRWASGATNGSDWITVDLGDYYYIDKVVLNWEAAYALEYKMQGSMDYMTYKDLASQKDGQGTIEEWTFESQLVRYVRMQGVKNKLG